MNNMNKMKIRLNATADVQEFVRAAEKCDFDIDIQYDSTIVDAKSILGIFSLGLAKIFTVNCHGENASGNVFVWNKNIIPKMLRFPTHCRRTAMR